MDTAVNFFPADEKDIVYVRPVAVSELPPEIRPQAGLREVVYAVPKADGAPVALVQNRQQALRLARVNDLTPVSVH